MESKVTSGETVIDNATSVDVKENDHSGVDAGDELSPKKAEVEEGAPTEKKRRSSGRKNRCDIDIMEEARAAYGELDATEGRRLRKRPEPPKVEKTPPAQKRRSGATPGSKKKGGEKQKEEESVQNTDEVKAEAVPEKAADAPGEADGVTSEKDEKKESVEQAVERDGQKPESEGNKPAATAEPSASDSIPDTAKPAVESDQKTAEPQAFDEAKKEGSE